MQKYIYISSPLRILKRFWTSVSFSSRFVFRFCGILFSTCHHITDFISATSALVLPSIRVSLLQSKAISSSLFVFHINIGLVSLLSFALHANRADWNILLCVPELSWYEQWAHCHTDKQYIFCQLLCEHEIQSDRWPFLAFWLHYHSLYGACPSVSKWGQCSRQVHQPQYLTRCLSSSDYSWSFCIYETPSSLPALLFWVGTVMNYILSINTLVHCVILRYL